MERKTVLNLYPFQRAAIDAVLANPDATRFLVASPTGTGKSLIQLELQKELGEGCWIITPQIEIIRGFLLKKGMTPTQLDSMSEKDFLAACERARITTPIRLKNRMSKGLFTHKITHIIWDEVHHHLAESYQLVSLMGGALQEIGFTATPYRGTPKGTAEFREQWGQPFWAITYPEAVENGYLSFPSIETVPLVDDEILTVKNGEFEVSTIEAATRDKLSDVVEKIVTNFTTEPRPTMVAAPTGKIANELHEAIGKRGFKSVCVTEETKSRGREIAFQRCVNADAILVQIRVVSEGVDLPIRRLWDLSPTLSPVRWLQQLGRIMRPTKGTPPEYYCCNRNLLRHAYLLNGLVPSAKLAESANAFPTPMVKSLGVRAVGLEAMGKLKPTTVRMSNGLPLVAYSVASIEGTDLIQWCILLHPATEEPLIARKVSVKDDNGCIAWGKWTRHDKVLTDLRGFKSTTPHAISQKQADWWARAAASRGLDGSITPDAKQFQVLPVLTDLGVKVS